MAKKATLQGRIQKVAISYLTSKLLWQKCILYNNTNIKLSVTKEFEFELAVPPWCHSYICHCQFKLRLQNNVNEVGDHGALTLFETQKKWDIKMVSGLNPM